MKRICSLIKRSLACATDLAIPREDPGVSAHDILMTGPVASILLIKIWGASRLPVAVVGLRCKIRHDAIADKAYLHSGQPLQRDKTPVFLNRLVKG